MGRSPLTSSAAWLAQLASLVSSSRRRISTPCEALRSCTNHQHKTHKTEVRKVHYPWHPLCGQEIPVRLERRWKNGWIARCDRDSDVGRRGFDIPGWMLDRALCSAMKLNATPFVDIEALT